METKTIREWLETLPDGYRERALANARNLGEWAESFSDALDNAFSWDGTSEKYVFWLDVDCFMRGHCALPSFPPPSKTESLKQRIAELEAALQSLLSYAATESRKQKNQDSDDPRLVGKLSAEHSSITAARETLSKKIE